LDHYKGLCSFFHAMLPRLNVREHHVYRLCSILYDTPHSQGPLCSMLKDGIDILLRTKRIIALA
jgi:hypothetical protein